MLRSGSSFIALLPVVVVMTYASRLHLDIIVVQGIILNIGVCVVG